MGGDRFERVVRITDLIHGIRAMDGQSLRYEPQMRETSAFQRTELLYRTILDKLPAAAYLCDSEGLITYFNRHAVHLWGRAPKLNDAADRYCGSFKLFSADGEAISHEHCWMALAIRNNREYNGEEILIERPKGERLAALAHASPIRDEFGKVLGAVNILVDISDRKKTEEALKEADRAKNLFLATLAHELRNPLAPIRNAMEILNLKSSPNPELRWALEVIGRQVEQMTRLIDDLLDVARITGNKLEIRKERVDLTEVLRLAIETSQPLIEACGQELCVQLPSQAITLDADSARLSQVISNLLNNAAKYTDRGGRITITASQSNGAASVSVVDSGMGIAPEMLHRIFEVFTQGEQSKAGPYGGLGIGLTLVKQLVELHGGMIRVKSDGPGKGSEFTVILPVAPENPASA
jgi:PAS domain S-box-containing protein